MPDQESHQSASIPLDCYTSVLMPPETRSITQEQLVNEVKGIYAGLVMIEKKCVEICALQASGKCDHISNEQYHGLIRSHREEIHRQHEYVRASHRPRWARRPLENEGIISCETWRPVSHYFLKLLRKKLPDLPEDVLFLVYPAYHVMALVAEYWSLSFEIFIKCLGKRLRPRLAVERTGQSERETWSTVPQTWYAEARGSSVNTGWIIKAIVKRQVFILIGLLTQITQKVHKGSRPWLARAKLENAATDIAIDPEMINVSSMEISATTVKMRTDHILAPDIVENEEPSQLSAICKLGQGDLRSRIKVAASLAPTLSDTNIIPYVHCMLAFLWSLLFIPAALTSLESKIARFLDASGHSLVSKTQLVSTESPDSTVAYEQRLLEDSNILGLVEAGRHPSTLVVQHNVVDEDERALDLPPNATSRAELCRWPGIPLANVCLLGLVLGSAPIAQARPAGGNSLPNPSDTNGLTGFFSAFLKHILLWVPTTLISSAIVLWTRNSLPLLPNPTVAANRPRTHGIAALLWNMALLMLNGEQTAPQMRYPILVACTLELLQYGDALFPELAAHFDFRPPVLIILGGLSLDGLMCFYMLPNQGIDVLVFMRLLPLGFWLALTFASWREPFAQWIRRLVRRVGELAIALGEVPQF